MARGAVLRAAVAAAILVCAACAPAGIEAQRVQSAAVPVPPSAPTVVPTAAPTVMPTAAATPLPTAVPDPTPIPIVDVRYRVDVRVADGEDFAPLLAQTMVDARGWSQAGFRVIEDPRAQYTVVLAEGDEVDRLCLPYDTGGSFSCQNGPVVAINADRWRVGVPHWPDDLHSYRVMLLNHEMGHLLGQRHRPCPGAGAPAPVMYQQSGGLAGCRANPWPLPSEIARAARHDLKLAPGYGE